MKYLCLICAEKVMEDMAPEEAQRQFAEYGEFTRDIKERGHFVSGNRLEPAAAATTLRVRDGAACVTDGPFAETKEQLGGYYIIEAKDLNEAIQVAAHIPGAKYGCVELRAIATDPDTRALELDESYRVDGRD